MKLLFLFVSFFLFSSSSFAEICRDKTEYLNAAVTYLNNMGDKPYNVKVSDISQPSFAWYAPFTVSGGGFGIMEGSQFDRFVSLVECEGSDGTYKNGSGFFFDSKSGQTIGGKFDVSDSPCAGNEEAFLSWFADFIKGWGGLKKVTATFPYVVYRTQPSGQKVLQVVGFAQAEKSVDGKVVTVPLSIGTWALCNKDKKYRTKVHYYYELKK